MKKQTLTEKQRRSRYRLRAIHREHTPNLDAWRAALDRSNLREVVEQAFGPPEKPSPKK